MAHWRQEAGNWVELLEKSENGASAAESADIPSNWNAN